jgi:hypothetical protein
VNGSVRAQSTCLTCCLQEEISLLKKNHDERAEFMRNEERRQQDQISRLKVQLEESRKSEEEARTRSRR